MLNPLPCAALSDTQKDTKPQKKDILKWIFKFQLKKKKRKILTLKVET